MGWHAEEMESRALACLDEEAEAASLDYWVTKNGDEMEPHEMSKGHLLNCIAMCERNEAEEYLIYKLMKEEVAKR